jgi:hypothetical protein
LAAPVRGEFFKVYAKCKYHFVEGFLISYKDQYNF